jgi:hypothetical protein
MTAPDDVRVEQVEDALLALSRATDPRILLERMGIRTIRGFEPHDTPGWPYTCPVAQYLCKVVGLKEGEIVITSKEVWIRGAVFDRWGQVEVALPAKVRALVGEIDNTDVGESE